MIENPTKMKQKEIKDKIRTNNISLGSPVSSLETTTIGGCWFWYQVVAIAVIGTRENPNKPTMERVSRVWLVSCCALLASTKNNATEVRSAKEFSLKSPQSHGFPHATEPHIGPEVITPMPNSNPISEPTEKHLQPISSFFKYQIIEPINNNKNAKNEHQANETCQ